MNQQSEYMMDEADVVGICLLMIVGGMLLIAVTIA